MKDVCFMHIQGGKLYDIIIIGHVLCNVLMFSNELNLSKHSTSLMFLLSVENFGRKLLNDCPMHDRWPDALVHHLLCGPQHATSYKDSK
jgi:hypothetical protein